MEYKLSDIFHEYYRITVVDWNIIHEMAYGLYTEVGTNHGASACAAASSDKVNSVISCDIYNWQPKIYEKYWPELKKKISFRKGTSEDIVDKRKTIAYIDTLFIDGSHEYDYVLRDCRALIPHVKREGVVLFHDFNLNNPNTGVYAAVNEYLDSVGHIGEGRQTIPGSSNILMISVRKFQNA